MTFANPSNQEIANLLKSARTLAVVGLSANPSRPSYEVAEAMQSFGFTILPVNPAIAEWQGIPAYATLEQAATRGIDIVNVFRQPEHVSGIVKDCLRLRLPALWLQLGVVDEAAAQTAQAGGMVVVMNKCIKVERLRARRSFA
jgi:predicted CoA-binding protein